MPMHHVHEHARNAAQPIGPGGIMRRRRSRAPCSRAAPVGGAAPTSGAGEAVGPEMGVSAFSATAGVSMGAKDLWNMAESGGIAARRAPGRPAVTALPALAAQPLGLVMNLRRHVE